MGLPDPGRDHGRGAQRTAARADEQDSLAALLRPTCGAAADLVAGTLLKRFGATADVLQASGDALLRSVPEHPEAAEQLTLMRATFEQALRGRVQDRPLLSDEGALLDYLFFTMGHAQAETVRLLLLDARNRLVRDELLALGSIGSVALHPREPVRCALEFGATAMILVHNHPSGDPTPSAADIDATRRLAAAAAMMDITLHDHLIVARGGWVSLKRMGVLA